MSKSTQAAKPGKGEPPFNPENLFVGGAVVTTPATVESQAPAAETGQAGEPGEEEGQGLPLEGSPAENSGNGEEPDTEGNEETPAVPVKPPLLKVTSLSKASLRQPSSGWFIAPGETRELLNDGWLENQVKARLLAQA